MEYKLSITNEECLYFRKGEKKILRYLNRFAFFSGIAHLADGSECDVVIEYDELGRRNDFITYFFVDDELISQNDENFPMRMGKMHHEIFPFILRYEYQYQDDVAEINDIG